MQPRQSLPTSRPEFNLLIMGDEGIDIDSLLARYLGNEPHTPNPEPIQTPRFQRLSLQRKNQQVTLLCWKMGANCAASVKNYTENKDAIIYISTSSSPNAQVERFNIPNKNIIVLENSPNLLTAFSNTLNNAIASKITPSTLPALIIKNPEPVLKAKPQHKRNYILVGLGAAIGLAALITGIVLSAGALIPIIAGAGAATAITASAVGASMVAAFGGLAHLAIAGLIGTVAGGLLFTGSTITLSKNRVERKEADVPQGAQPAPQQKNRFSTTYLRTVSTRSNISRSSSSEERLRASGSLPDPNLSGLPLTIFAQPLQRTARANEATQTHKP